MNRYGRDYKEDRVYLEKSPFPLPIVAFFCVILLAIAVVYTWFDGKHRATQRQKMAEADQELLTSAPLPDQSVPETPVVIVQDQIPVMRAVPVNPVSIDRNALPPLEFPLGTEVRAATAVSAETASAVPPPSSASPPMEVRRAEPVNP